MHLLGNMYLLWLCGCSIEDIWGRPLYAAVYGLGGVAATLAHGWFQSDSTAHLVGASGAIAALMGVFFVRCWNTRIRFVYWFALAIFGTFTAPAWIMLLLWLGRELIAAAAFAGSPVAFWAHIGGFGFGALAAYAMKLSRLEERVIAPSIDRKTNLVTKHPRLTSALAHLDAGNPESAIEDLSLAIREDPEDPDLYQWIARCYMNLGRPDEAAPYLHRELGIHLRNRETELVAQTYMELVGAEPDFELPSKQLPSIASSLAGAGYPTEAGELLEKAMRKTSEPLLRLRAGIALAVLHHEQGRTQKGLALLEELAPLAASHPEWQMSIAQKRQAILSSR
jgi:tetratricopeptide (TPR) repeat protein